MSMALLELPAELRLQVYDFLPDLSHGRHETVAPGLTRLTPAICQASQQLRHETLPIYAEHSHFIIQTDDITKAQDSRTAVWLRALGPKGVGLIRSLQLNRHWGMSQPVRWQGHVGLYVRLQVVDKAWQCTTGTYPVARDVRGMRLESVNLLQYVVSRNVLQPLISREKKALSWSDVDLVVAAMEIVASHPISAYDTEQSELGRKRRRETWSDMERQLYALDASKGLEIDRRQFFTPY